MARIVNNRLLFWSLLTGLLYWTVARYAVPGPVLSSTMSLLLLIFGGVVFVRYAMEAWPLLFSKHRVDKAEDRGGNLSIYGVTLLSFGSCYVGLFGLLWIYSGQPGHWLGSAVSGFGRGVMAAGFALLFFSPDVARRGFRLPVKAWLFAVAVLALAAAFALGLSIGRDATHLGLIDVVSCRAIGACSVAGAPAERLG